MRPGRAGEARMRRRWPMIGSPPAGFWPSCTFDTHEASGGPGLDRGSSIVPLRRDESHQPPGFPDTVSLPPRLAAIRFPGGCGRPCMSPGLFRGAGDPPQLQYENQDQINRRRDLPSTTTQGTSTCAVLVEELFIPRRPEPEPRQPRYTTRRRLAIKGSRPCWDWYLHIMTAAAYRCTLSRGCPKQRDSPGRRCCPGLCTTQANDGSTPDQAPNGFVVLHVA